MPIFNSVSGGDSTMTTHIEYIKQVASIVKV
ncbi:hypothetical protein LCGC14_2044320, partial [marine sediment metagenome]